MRIKVKLLDNQRDITQSIITLKLKKSNILDAGRGLFLVNDSNDTVKLKEGTIIGWYSGQLRVCNDELIHDPYTMTIGYKDRNRILVDGEKDRNNYVKWINDLNYGSPVDLNAHNVKFWDGLETNDAHRYPFCALERDIVLLRKAEEELYANYEWGGEIPLAGKALARVQNYDVNLEELSLELQNQFKEDLFELQQFTIQSGDKIDWEAPEELLEVHDPQGEYDSKIDDMNLYRYQQWFRHTFYGHPETATINAEIASTIYNRYRNFKPWAAKMDSTRSSAKKDKTWRWALNPHKYDFPGVDTQRRRR